VRFLSDGFEFASGEAKSKQKGFKLGYQQLAVNC
jgi:hypothetical protein